MSRLDVRIHPDPVLRKNGKTVEAFDDGLRRILDDMAETMYANNGIGLAAQQVGLTHRMLVADVPGGEEGQDSGLLYVVNPRIIASDGRITLNEGCLSFPGLEIDVTRAAEVTVEYQDEHGEIRVIEAEGLLAVCLQHEMDHLDGVLFVDRLGPVARRLALRRYQKLLETAQTGTKGS